MMFWLGFVTGSVVTAILMIVLVVEWGSHAIRKGGSTAEGFGLWRVVKRLIGAAALLIVVGCSSSPTAPTPPVTPPPVVVVPPPVVTPPVVMPAPNPLLSDPRFDRTFYQQFALGTLEFPMQPLRRQTQAPRIYLRTIDDAGAPMDTFTLDQTAAALINTAGALTGVFGLAGLDRGTETRQGQPGWITVRWSSQPSAYCGYALYAGDLITLYPRTPGCRCAGGPAVRLKTVKHELGHVLGFYHTTGTSNLMTQGGTACDMNPSDREVFHARLAYSMAIGSLDP